MEFSHSLSLRKRIAEAELINWQGQAFVPHYRLLNILQPDIIKSVFEEKGIERYQENEAIEAVYHGGYRTFAILNVLDQEESILLFRGKSDNFLHKSLDSGLPYEQHFLESLLPDHYHSFYKIQWKFNCPLFKRNLQGQLLPHRTILPFLKVEDVSSRGAFAEVSRVTLSGSHQAIQSETSGDVVVIQKRLNLSNNVEKNFKHEQHILSMLRVLKHPNIVEFHTAFTFESRPTLLFGEADYDLREWLRSDKARCFSEIEIIEALHGLSSALAQMHEYLVEGQHSVMVGCHFDLHPGNILVRGRSFILSDFGLSRLKYEIQGSQSYFKGGVRDYCAPECQQWEDDFDRNKSGRPSDIWSFGCIIAEIATLLKHGLEGLRTFDEIRKVEGAFLVLRTFHDRGQPHQGVQAMIEELKGDATQHTSAAGLANVIGHMLIVDPRARWSASIVCAQLYLLALNFRYLEAATSLRNLASATDLAWKIEYDKLKVWARQMGLSNPLPSERSIKWLLEPSSLVQRENIWRLLLRIRDDCDAQSQHLSSHSSAGSYESLPLHVLRLLIDELWRTQTPQNIHKMNVELEHLILDVNAEESTRIARVLPKGSRPQLLLAIKEAMTAADQNMTVKESVMVDQALIQEHQTWQRKAMGRKKAADNLVEEYILTEFLEYEDSWIGRSKELISRINGLVLVLRKSQIDKKLPILRCKYFCHCPGRQAYGIMYEIPREFIPSGGFPTPLNLAEVISRLSSRAKRPALGEVFDLAHTLATSVLSFHKAGWLHKSICPYNVIFFPRGSDNSGALLSTVRLIGFNYSRESDVGVITVGPREDKYIRDYQHPEYRRGAGGGDGTTTTVRFREEFDYYGLGLVLLELGRWKVLRDLITDNGKETLSPQALKTWLLEEEVSQLKAIRGVYYHDAVVACLSGFGSTTEASTPARSWWPEFEWKVVQPLNKCLAVHPHVR